MEALPSRLMSSGLKTSPAGIMPWRIWRLTDEEERTVDGGVVVEEPLEICLNGQPVAVLMRTPGLEKELAAGFCLGEGLVADLMDIALVRHCGRAVPDEAGRGRSPGRIAQPGGRDPDAGCGRARPVAGCGAVDPLWLWADRRVVRWPRT